MTIRAALFGEPRPPQTDTVLERTKGDASAALRRAGADLADLANGVRGTSHPLLDGAAAGFGDMAYQLEQCAATIEAAQTPLRVVLMGRTMAGKSTLFEYLTGGDGARIGDGRQRYSRDIKERPLAHHAGAVLVDTPGVGAMDGAEDFARAFEAAEGADLVLWVNTNNSTQQETAAALEALARTGAPLLVVLNCRWDLDDQDLMEDFRLDPEEPFASVEGHERRIQRILDEHAQVPVALVTAHVGAAWRSTNAVGDERRFLYGSSRIDDLHTALVEELGGRADQRRLLWQVDSSGVPMRNAAQSLAGQARELDRQVCEGRAALADMQMRVERAIESERVRTTNRMFGAIRSKRGWADANYRLSDKKLDTAWRRMSEELAASLIAIHDEGVEELKARASSEAAAASEDWADRMGAPDWDVPHVSGRYEGEQTWRKRVTVGLEAGLPLALAGVGALVGGPPGAIFGGVVGSVVSALAKGPLGSWVRGLSKKRRKALRSQADEALDAFAEQSTERWNEAASKAAAAVVGAVDEQRDGLKQVEQRSGEIAGTSQRLLHLADSLDTAAVCALLELSGRPRLAEAVNESCRRAGFLALVGIDDSLLEEVTLWPPSGVVENLRFYPSAGHAAGQAGRLAYAADIGRGTRQLRSDGQNGFILGVNGQADGVLEAEAALLRRVIDVELSFDRNQPVGEGAI